MMDTQDIFDAFCAPFPVEEISWRVGPTNSGSRTSNDQPLRGQPLCYIDARTVMDRLDSVNGFDGWQCNYTPGPGHSIVCNLGVLIAGDWIWKADGAGASEMEAEKGALSDAFKRAAVRFGIGRYLYEIKAPWIQLEARGKSAIIPDNAYPGLNKIYEDAAKKAGWGEASGVPAYRLLVAELDSLTPSSRQGFAVTHKDRIAQLPPAMRKHLLGKLELTAA